MESLYGEFGEKLKAARQAAGLTQGEVGDRVNLTRTSVTNIERGTQRVLLHQLLNLAAAVGVAPAELLPGQTTRPLEQLLSREDLSEMPESEEDRRALARLLIDVGPVGSEKSGES